MIHRIALVLILLASLTPIGARAADAGAPVIRSLADLEGKRLGVISGTVIDNAANDNLDFTQMFYYDDRSAQIAALVAGEIDALLDDEPAVRFLASMHPELALLPGKIGNDEYGFAIRHGEPTLYEKLNTQLQAFLKDGTVDRLARKWLDSPDPAARVMPPPSDRDSGPVLRMGVSTVSEPFVYHVDGKAGGLDIELVGMIAEKLGMRLEIVEMEFSRLISALQGGEVDIIGSCLSITDERKRLAHFTDSYYRGGVSAVVLKQRTEE